MPSNPAFLFVYGTLRKGGSHSLAGFLAEKGRFVGEGRTPGQLYHLGPYPGMTPAERADEWVKGDVFELDDAAGVLAVLDRYEGCDRAEPLYERVQAPVTMTDGKELFAWLYLYRGLVQAEQRIESGEFG